MHEAKAKGGEDRRRRSAEANSGVKQFHCWPWTLDLA